MKTTIKIGNYIFDSTSIISGSGIITKSMIAETLAGNVLTFVVCAKYGGEALYDSNLNRLYDVDEVPLYVRVGDKDIPITELKRGTPVEIYRGEDSWSRMFVDYVALSDIGLYTLHLISAIGILEKVKHNGGMYNGAVWGDVCADILKATLTSSANGNNVYTSEYGFTYNVPDEINNLVVNNRLPRTWSRDNLRQLMFPYGVSLINNLDGSIDFTYNLPETTTPIPDTDVGKGGRSITPPTITNVSVTEHSYYQASGTEEEVLFDGSGVDSVGALIEFDEACYDLTATPQSGYTFVIDESNCNYAKVTGRGVLTGKRYAHNTVTLTMATGGTGVDSDIAYSDMLLVSSLNSENTIKRLANYYGNATFIERLIPMEKRTCGELVNIKAPFSKDYVNAFVQTLNPVFSGTLFGKARLVANWTPKYIGDDYDSYLIIKATDLVNGTWTPPAELVGKSAKITLFSGAQGGQGGYAGNDAGETSGSGVHFVRFNQADYPYSYYILVGDTQYSPQKGGKGGKGGQGGKSASKIIEGKFTISASHSVSFGAGGLGGTGGTTSTPPTEGQLGAHSTFDSLDTDNGVAFEGNYVNLITGETIAEQGAEGDRGGDGGEGGRTSALELFNTRADAEQFTWNGDGQNGESVGEDTGGLAGVGVTGQLQAFTDSQKGTVWGVRGNCGGGGGGGSAKGGTPSNGMDAVYNRDFWSVPVSGIGYENVPCYGVGSYNMTQATFYCAKGGNGADAVTVPDQVIYKGGTGGNGGGGGGGAGQPAGRLAGGGNVSYGYAIGGNGGNGSNGGQGSDGFAILYYKA